MLSLERSSHKSLFFLCSSTIHKKVDLITFLVLNSCFEFKKLAKWLICQLASCKYWQHHSTGSLEIDNSQT